MDFDYSKLKGRIIEVYGKQAAFAAAMGLSERTMSLKMKNKREWKQGEIEKACTLLHVPSCEINVYFFNRDAQY